jgi:hypothetical protein
MANKDKPNEQLALKVRAMDLMKYTYQIIQKFPKVERFALTESIKVGTNRAVRLSVHIASYYERENRRELLKELYAEIKTLEIFVQTAYECKYITPQNYEAWTRKLVNIGNMVVGWLRKP